MHDELNFRLEQLLYANKLPVDFEYNPNSKYTEEGRDKMFGDMGDKPKGPAPAAGIGGLAAALAANKANTTTDTSSSSLLSATSMTRPAPLSVPGKGVVFQTGGGGLHDRASPAMLSDGTQSPALGTGGLDTPGSQPSSAGSRLSPREAARRFSSAVVRAGSIKTAKLEV